MRTVICLSVVFVTAVAAMAQDRPRNPRTIEELEIVFRPAVFARDAFPRPEFDQPAAAEKILGKYTLKTTYYDAAYAPTTRPAKPGRYGAITQITAESGQTSMRFNTLFRQAGPPRVEWEEFETNFASQLPAELGISPAVAREQSWHVANHIAKLVGESFNTTSGTAALLAGLYETPSGVGRLPKRLAPADRDRFWWYGLKKKLGMEPRYHYATILPDGYDADPRKAWPLLIFLHGSGERGDDLKKVTDTHGPQKYFRQGHPNPFILIIPQCPQREWWLAPELVAMIDEVQAQHRVDADRVYLTGLSMGGYGTYDLAMFDPSRFAALVPICGAGDVTDVDRIREIPTWIFHGGRDEAVPVQRSIDMARALAHAHARATWTIYPGLPHDSWTVTYSNPALYEWILRQRRGRPDQPHLSGNGPAPLP